MILLDSYSGVVRVKTKTAVNVEDTSTVAKGAKLVEFDPDGVARVMRAHRNMVANAVPFLILGFLWVLLGASAATAQIVFGVFVGARVIHSFAYVGAKQPFRTLSFVVGQLALAYVLVEVVRGAFAAMA